MTSQMLVTELSAIRIGVGSAIHVTLPIDRFGYLSDKRARVSYIDNGPNAPAQIAIQPSVSGSMFKPKGKKPKKIHAMFNRSSNTGLPADLNFGSTSPSAVEYVEGGAVVLTLPMSNDLPEVALNWRSAAKATEDAIAADTTDLFSSIEGVDVPDVVSGAITEGMKLDSFQQPPQTTHLADSGISPQQGRMVSATENQSVVDPADTPQIAEVTEIPPAEVGRVDSDNPLMVEEQGLEDLVFLDEEGNTTAVADLELGLNEPSAPAIPLELVSLDFGEIAELAEEVRDAVAKINAARDKMGSQFNAKIDDDGHVSVDLAVTARIRI